MPIARWTANAETDLRGIAFRIAIADGRPVTADRIIDELIAQSQKLADLHLVATLGILTNVAGEKARLFQFKRWVLIFRYTDQGIDVLRIADGSQNFQSWKLS